MSSTNRGYDRHKSDYYVTPIQPIKEFLSSFLTLESKCPDKNSRTERPDKMSWLDPCAGGDANNPMSYPTVLLDAFEPSVVTIDVREDSLAEIKTDFLQWNNNFKFDAIITNPPFNIALDIIKKSFEHITDNGYVIMLLRLNFFGSKERKAFFDKHMPKYCFVHSKRMSFTKGQTDSIEYAHFVWQKGYNKDFTKLYLI